MRKHENKPLPDVPLNNPFSLDDLIQERQRLQDELERLEKTIAHRLVDLDLST